jgi:oligopeptide/dipeptide ABC transporter ATP-binding protein
MRSAARRMQMVFQDPYSAIDPRYTVARAVIEPFDVQGRKPEGSVAEEVATLLEMVGLNPGLASSFPHQISGGQKQRVGSPGRSRCDRPCWCLMNRRLRWTCRSKRKSSGLLETLRDELGLTYLFISHDLSLVKYFCDEILVMYLGRVVEALPDTDAPARHPYTKTLMDSTFEPDPKKRRLIAPLEGEVPSPFDLPPGCAFADRCPHATDICRSETPALAAKGGHAVACHHPI